MRSEGQPVGAEGDGSDQDAASAHVDNQCPLEDTHDKYNEAHYFLDQMMGEWHQPEPLRWSLNAFLQALRNVTFYLQKLLTPQEGFLAWYEAQQSRMRADELLRKFVEGRNVVVKQRNLVIESVAHIGVFRHRKPKLGIQLPMPAHFPSAYILSELAPKLRFIDDHRSAIGEEYGVQRTWIVRELGEDNVLRLCDQAWSKIGHVLAEAHDFIGRKWEPPPPHGHDPGLCDLLTETDVDPTLIQKWAWA
jgi:hypothetical protein